MKIAGIIAEYNPFHLGHAYQCAQVRKMGYDGIAAVMSGNFVQRADVSLTDKYSRAAGAVASGVDLVLELPLPYAVASAEDFARGGVGILAATGVIDAVCCGCESDEETNLKQYEALCRAEREGKIGEKMKIGLSYPAACRAAVTETGQSWSEKPNDVLALAYRKALDRYAPLIPLKTVLRRGDYHGSGEIGFESAESIRNRLRRGEDVADSLPEGSLRFFSNGNTADLSRLERAILAYYRTGTPKELKQYYGMREGLAERIVAASGEPTLQELYNRAKTKRFPHSAVRRAVLCGYLQIPSGLPSLSYLRPLAFNGRGREILRQIKNKATLPLCNTLSPDMIGDPLVKLQLRGDEIYALTSEFPRPRREDMIRSPQFFPAPTL